MPPRDRAALGQTTLAALALGLPLAAGLVGMGWLVSDGLYQARAADRFVAVKGLAEREVPADLALWPIVFSVTADDLTTLQSRIDASADAVRAFLEPSFPGDAVEASVPRITDRQGQSFGPGGAPLERYLAEATVTLRSANIEAVKQAMQRGGELVRQGVAVIRSYESNPQFLFTSLEALKPGMIAEATRDARRAAEQFAEDSGSRVGAIRNAQQGYFSIEDRDAFTPEQKKVRVVTTVQYFLADE
jgi:uncharacterized protein